MILADTGFLSRELAGIRLRLDDMVTTDELEDMRDVIDHAIANVNNDDATPDK